MCEMPNDRNAWAVDLLEVTPDDRILEIGSGPGVATRLIGDRLGGGHLTAIDRSATAVQRARGRNEAHVAAGRVTVEQVELARFGGEPDQFDKALAVNVNVFWTTPAEAECAVLRRVLRPEGRLLLVYGGPPPRDGARGTGAGNGDGGRDVTSRIATTLQREGFEPEVVRGASGLVAITGRLPA
jgi:SAM-dependent methyltransferase